MKLKVLALAMVISPLLQAKEQVLKVDGLVCSFCAQGIEKSFKKDSRVKDVVVDLKAKKVVLNLHENQSISKEEYQKILEDAGYTLVGVE